MILSEAVVAELTKAGVQATASTVKSEERSIWIAHFRPENGEPQTSILLLPKDGTYFLIFAAIVPPRSLETLSDKVLRDLIRLSSSVKLAKLEYLETDDDDKTENRTGFFFATSECSIDGYTGEKLRRRMEACATLAAKISKVL